MNAGISDNRENGVSPERWARKLTARMLKQAEIWPRNVVKGDDIPVDYRVLGQIAEGLDDVWVLSAERFPFSRNKAHLAFQVGGDGAVSIEFDFFCGVRAYRTAADAT